MNTLALLEIVANSDESIRHSAIAFALRSRGYSYARIGRDLGITRQAVLHVRHRKYPAVEAAIAAVLGVSPPQIWPERYDADGQPIRQRPRAARCRPEFRGKRS